MAKLMKPPTDGFDNTDAGGGDWYDGPPPPNGVYKGKIKYLAIGKIATGENKGGQRIAVVVEITEGKYRGAGIGTGLNLTKQGEPYVNQFLRSLTDGSEAQWKGIREAFWRTGYLVGEPDNKHRLPIERIGKKTNPIGMSLTFATKLRTRNDNGETIADIARFLSPAQGEGAEEEPEADESFSDALSEVEDSVDTEVALDVDADDDPWSV